MERYKSRFREQVLSVPTEINLDNPSDEEILRIGISAEQSAINLYLQLSKYARNDKLKRVLIDIAKEEKVHVAEFQGLLEKIDSEEIEAQIEGREEVEDL